MAILDTSTLGLPLAADDLLGTGALGFSPGLSTALQIGLFRTPLISPFLSPFISPLIRPFLISPFISPLISPFLISPFIFPFLVRRFPRRIIIRRRFIDDV